jgi:predicted DNA-binding transcriptional regulator AlpA
VGLNESNSSLAEALAAILKPIVTQAVREAMNGHREEDRLLDAEEASRLLCVSEDWLYRHARKLPFTRRLGPDASLFLSRNPEIPCYKKNSLTWTRLWYTHWIL